MDQSRWAGLATGAQSPEEKAGKKTAAHSVGALASLRLVCLPFGHFRARRAQGGAPHDPEKAGPRLEGELGNQW